MQNAKKGDKVKVHYTGKLDNGEIFDSSEGKEPLEFTLGENQVLQKFEETVEGMKVGESTNVSIPAADAYGSRQNDLIIKLPLNRLPESVKPEIGMKLKMQTKQGEIIVVTVMGIGENDITIDANHELADKDLHFQIELLKIL